MYKNINIFQMFALTLIYTEQERFCSPKWKLFMEISYENVFKPVSNSLVNFSIT